MPPYSYTSIETNRKESSTSSCLYRLLVFWDQVSEYYENSIFGLAIIIASYFTIWKPRGVAVANLGLYALFPDYLLYYSAQFVFNAERYRIDNSTYIPYHLHRMKSGAPKARLLVAKFIVTIYSNLMVRHFQFQLLMLVFFTFEKRFATWYDNLHLFDFATIVYNLNRDRHI